MRTYSVNIQISLGRWCTVRESSRHIMYLLSRGKLVKTSVTGTSFERAQTASRTVETFYILLRQLFPRGVKYVSGGLCLFIRLLLFSAVPSRRKFTPEKKKRARYKYRLICRL